MLKETISREMRPSIRKAFERARKRSYMFSMSAKKSQRNRSQGSSRKKRKLFEVLTLIASTLTYWGKKYNYRTEMYERVILYSFDEVFNDGEAIGRRPKIAIGKKNIKRMKGRR